MGAQIVCFWGVRTIIKVGVAQRGIRAVSAAFSDALFFAARSVSGLRISVDELFPSHVPSPRVFPSCVCNANLSFLYVSGECHAECDSQIFPSAHLRITFIICVPGRFNAAKMMERYVIRALFWNVVFADAHLYALD